MAASVLFDAPGPKTRARHRVLSIISGLILVALAAFMVWRFWSEGQFAQRYWEPFVTPRIIKELGAGIVQTLLAAVIAIFAALIFGLVFGPGKLSNYRIVRWPSWLIVEFFRAVPVLMLIIAIWFYIGPQQGNNAFAALVVALILYNGAVLAEIIRAGIQAVPSGQSEAAYGIGMGKTQVTRIILLPQAIKMMLPTIISQAVVALKDTSLGYVVLAPGLTYSGKLIFGEFRNTLQTVFVVSILYIIMNLALTLAANFAQKRFAGEKQIQVDDAGDITDRSTGNGKIGATP